MNKDKNELILKWAEFFKGFKCIELIKNYRLAERIAYIEFIQRLNEIINDNQNEYFVGIGERKQGKGRAKANDITQLHGYVIDLDLNLNYIPEKEEVKIITQKIFDKFSILKNYWSINFSGRGLHIWYKFNKTISKNDWENIYKHIWERLLKELKKEINAIDEKIIDVSRIIRVPGSINKKSNLRAQVLDFKGEEIDIDNLKIIIDQLDIEETQDKVIESLINEGKKTSNNFLINKKLTLSLDEAVEKVLQEVSLAELLRSYGFDYKEYPRYYMFKCPFHNDGKNPDFSIWKDNESWGKDWHDDRNYNPINFLMRYEGLSFWEALEKLDEEYDLGLFEEIEENFSTNPHSVEKAINNLNTTLFIEIINKELEPFDLLIIKRKGDYYLAEVKKTKKGPQINIISEVALPICLYRENKKEQKIFWFILRDEKSLHKLLKMYKNKEVIDMESENIVILDFGKGKRLEQITDHFFVRSKLHKIGIFLKTIFKILKENKILFEIKTYDRIGWFKIKDENKNLRFIHPELLDNNNELIDISDTIENNLINDNPEKNIIAYLDIFKYLNDYQIAIYNYGVGAFLVEPLNKPNFIINLCGQRGSGKTFSARIIQSIYKNPENVNTLSTTLFAFEKYVHEEGELHIFDELELGNLEEIVKSIYKFYAQTGKIRGNIKLKIRKSFRLRGALILTGERSIRNIIEATIQRTGFKKLGAVRRTIEIDIPRGFFSQENTREIYKIITKHYGTMIKVLTDVIIENLEYYNNKYDELHEALIQHKNIEFIHLNSLCLNLLGLRTLVDIFNKVGKEIPFNIKNIIKHAIKITIDNSEHLNSEDETISMFANAVLELINDDEEIHIKIENFEKIPKKAKARIQNKDEKLYFYITPQKLKEICTKYGIDFNILLKELKREKLLPTTEKKSIRAKYYDTNERKVKSTVLKAFEIELPIKVNLDALKDIDDLIETDDYELKDVFKFTFQRETEKIEIEELVNKVYKILFGEDNPDNENDDNNDNMPSETDDSNNSESSNTTKGSDTTNIDSNEIELSNNHETSQKENILRKIKQELEELRKEGLLELELPFGTLTIEKLKEMLPNLSFDKLLEIKNYLGISEH